MHATHTLDDVGLRRELDACNAHSEAALSGHEEIAQGDKRCEEGAEVCV